MIVVIGRRIKAQDLRRWVRIESKAQVAFDYERIALSTSSAVAGAKK